MRCLLISLLAVVLVGTICQADKIDYNNPVRSAADDEIHNLPGLNTTINFKQYSGYLSVDDSNTKFFHYWFVESQSKPSEDPLLLWLNGGPGCSSLGGFLTELGPFRIKPGTSTLEINDYSWNKVANVIFLESPIEVGFSYALQEEDGQSDDSTARYNHMALKSFMKKFPEYKNRPLYLSGESYAGVYLPTLGVLVDADPDLNLKGIAIGNGYLDSQKLMESLVYFSYAHGLFGKTIWDDISKKCCDGKIPTVESCTLIGPKVTQICSDEIMHSLDYQLVGINPYNIYGTCHNNNHDSGNRIIMNTLIRKAMESSGFRLDRTRDGNIGDVICIDETDIDNYLYLDDVRTALHIPEDVPSWYLCTDSFASYGMQYPGRPGGLTPQINSLIESKRNLTLLVYNGDADSVCNFLGNEWFVDNLGRKLINDYQPWKVNNQVGGYVKHFDGITFATVRGSGHMVPGDRPVEALYMIKKFLDSDNQNVNL